MSTFGFKFDGSRVDSDLFDNGVEGSYPTLIWHAKYAGNPEACGFWSLDRDSTDTAPDPTWHEAEITFSADPNAEPTAVWKSGRARVCVLAVRKRQIITAEDGSIHTYRWLTKKSDRVPGKFKAHIQVAVTLPDTGDDIYVIGLKGLTKTAAWGNPPNGRFRLDRFPTGAEFLLREYAKAASKAIGANIPEHCTFWLDLVPVKNEKGKPAYVDVGHGTHVLPFMPDLSDTPELESRFVGMSNFLRFQELKRELEPWSKAWDNPGATAEPVDVYAELPEVEDELMAI